MGEYKTVLGIIHDDVPPVKKEQATPLGKRLISHFLKRGSQAKPTSPITPPLSETIYVPGYANKRAQTQH